MSNYIPTDLLIQILVKLPVKSLIRFITVSKSWRSIITSPDFIPSHLSNNCKNQTLLVLRYPSLLEVTESGVSSSSNLKVPFTSSQALFLRIVGSCDGLVCLSDDLIGNPFQPTVIIWNPSVRNHVVLPRPTINPEESHFAVLGFGVAASHLYKVVRLIYSTRSTGVDFGGRPMVEIFSLKTRSWRKVSGVDVSLRALLYRPALLNGVVHWLSHKQINGNTYGYSVLTFDIGDEVFDEVMLPDELASDGLLKLSVFVIGKSSLGVSKCDGDTCDVWMMKEYCVKESWTKLYRIDLHEGIQRAIIVGFSKSGEALLALQKLDLVETHRIDLFAYNPGTRWIKDLGISGRNQLFYIDNYVESLLLLREHM